MEMETPKWVMWLWEPVRQTGIVGQQLSLGHISYFEAKWL